MPAPSPLKNLFTALFGKTLNMPADKVASLFTNDEGTELKPEALDTLLALHSAHVTNLKAENQTYFDNGMKKATKEILTDFEKKVKEKYGITSEKQGEELIEEIVLSKAKPGELDESKVKLHPLYLELEGKMTKAVKETEKTWKEKLDGIEKTHAKEKTFSGVIKKAEAVLPGFALPEDEKLRENQKKLLKLDLEGYEYQANGEELIVLKDGKPVEDEHGHKIAFDNFVKGIAANYWPKLDGKERSGAGGSNNPAGKGTAGSKWSGKVPSSEQEYSQMIAGAKTSEDRIAITDAWDAAQK